MAASVARTWVTAQPELVPVELPPLVVPAELVFVLVLVLVLTPVEPAVEVEPPVLTAVEVEVAVVVVPPDVPADAVDAPALVPCDAVELPALKAPPLEAPGCDDRPPEVQPAPIATSHTHSALERRPTPLD